MIDFKPRSKLLLEEISEKKIPNDSTRVVDIDNETENITGQKVIMPRRSRRIRRPPEC